MNESELVQKFIEKTKQYKYISFDLFDTLIFRTYQSPKDVFNAVEHVYNARHKEKIKNFCKLRYKAELKARKKARDKEITINNIYDYIESKNKDILKLYEKNIEIENCVPNKIMYEVLKALQDMGRKIIITTDMYLDTETINNILSKIRINNYILFLSSEIGFTKISGKLFPFIIHTLGIDKNEIVHIGDNPISDIKQATAAGIAAIERPMPNINLFGEIYWKGLKGIVPNHIKNFCRLTSMDNSTENNIGYTVLGPIITEFCHWINCQQIEKHADMILFVAREGYLLEKAYLAMFPEQKSKVGYIQLNKNLMRFPSLYINPTIKQLLATIPMKDVYTATELLATLYLNKNNSSKTNAINELPAQISRKDLLNGKYDCIFSKLFTSLKAEFQVQYECLLEYLGTKNILGNKVLLVNNSINGNGQIMLEKILNVAGLPSNIYGVQFVKSRRCKKVLSNKSLSWIKNTYQTMQFNRYALILEHLMFESAGTALYLKKDTYKTEVICDIQGKEAYNNRYIARIQNSALQYVTAYKSHAPIYMGSHIINVIYNLYRHPQYEIANLIGHLYDVDRDGSKYLIDYLNWKQAKIAISNGNKNLPREYVNVIENLQSAIKTIASKIKDIMDIK